MVRVVAANRAPPVPVQAAAAQALAAEDALHATSNGAHYRTVDGLHALGRRVVALTVVDLYESLLD